MKACRVFLAIILVVAAVFLIVCDDDSDDGIKSQSTYTAIDLEGYWIGPIVIITNGTSLDPRNSIVRFDAQGGVTEFATSNMQNEASVGGQLTVSGTGVITGNMVSYDDMYLGDHLIPAPVTLTCTGSFLSKSELTMTMSVSCTDTSGANVLLTMELTLYNEDAGFEYIDVTLNRWENHTGTWWLNIKAYVEGATRVYATGGIIVGEYDLYECDAFGYLDYWWSSNNAECEISDNNYSIHYDPTLPFDVIVHVVKPAGVTTETITINNYNTIEDESSITVTEYSGGWSFNETTISSTGECQ